MGWVVIGVRFGLWLLVLGWPLCCGGLRGGVGGEEGLRCERLGKSQAAK